MSEIPTSDETAAAYTALTDALIAIDSKIADLVEYMADRVEEATGIRP